MRSHAMPCQECVMSKSGIVYFQLLGTSMQDEWVQRHVMYPGLQETLKSCKYPWYVVTSRAKHRTLKLIDALLDMQWPEDTPRLYSKMLPPNEKKIETLQ